MKELWQQWEGQVVDGEFQLGRYLGGSEQAGVFVAESAGAQHAQAAVKLFLDDPELNPGRLAALEAAAQMSHPHLIPVFRAGRCQIADTPVLYAVMEYAEEHLGEVIPLRPLAPEEAREVLQSTLDALSYLHRNGWTHGSVKPSNVLAIGNDLKLSSDALRKNGDPADDVWNVGSLLVESLTQRPVLWSGHEDPGVPASLPAPFREIARNCLRRYPRDRWTLDRIEEALSPQAEEPIARASEAPLPAVVPAPSRKRQYVVPALVGLALAAAVAGSGLLNHREPAAPPKPEATPRAVPAPPAPKPEPSPPPKAAPRAFVPGKVANQVVPEVPPKALKTIQGHVRVKVEVRVDSAGNVEEAKMDSPNASPYFAQRALQAARRWKFEPPKVNGREVSSFWTLQFDFARSGTKVRSVRGS